MAGPGAVALQEFFRDRDLKEQAASQRPVIQDSRRVDLVTCNYLLDRNERNNPPFNGNMCCKKLNCCGKYRPEDVLVLRQLLLSRPRGSTDRRAFLSARYTERRHDQGRGSGKFYCDSPQVCRLQTYIANPELMPMSPLEKIPVCANFFHWAYSVSRVRPNAETIVHAHSVQEAKACQ